MNRRDFIKRSIQLASQAALVHQLPLLGHAAAGELPATPIWEGIYTSRFTHRAGTEAIEVHASLLDVTSVDVTLRHLDGPTLDAVVGVYSIAVDSTQVPCYPGIPSGGAGIMGPQFPVRLAIDTQGLESGLYEISIDPLAMRPENRENFSSSGLVSLNSVSRFVVTAASPGSESNILWLHDPLSGTAYGAFGGESIYGGAAVKSPTVSYRRPGLDRVTADGKRMLRKFKGDGYLFEYMDAIEFAAQPSAFSLNYDLIITVGKFEYLPHSFFVNLQSHIDSGRNLLIASNEFGTFRTRLDSAAHTMTTYKWSAGADDPISGPGLAGVGMHNPQTIWETELMGMSIWGAHNMFGLPRQDMTITNSADTGWLFDGTGFGSVIPSIIAFFNAGNSGAFGQGDQFSILNAAQSRTPADTVVWAVTPSTDGRKWWEALPSQDVSGWPIDPTGHVVCTWRETATGARIIGMPSQSFMQGNYKKPGTKELFENILAYLTVRSPAVPVPGLSGLGLTGAAAILAKAGHRMLS